jgi:putative membrane protein
MSSSLTARWMAAMGGLLLSTAVLAQNLSSNDRDFLEQAAQNGHAEISASRLALEKTRNEQVRSFAQRMVDDHTRANEELRTLAMSKRVELPTEPSLLQKGKEMLISGLSDDSFDRRYVNQMGVEAHEDNIELFEKTSREAQDPDVKAYATKSLPALRSHLEAARGLKTRLESGGQNQPQRQQTPGQSPNQR